MFTAKNKQGELVCLADMKREREELLQLRKQGYVCPCCEGKLILKVGSHRVAHFAHEKNSACSAQYEHESEYHLTGKLELYKWLQQKGVQPELEKYLPTIGQRPDIYFTFNQQTFCLEFQCSSLSDELFHNRTQGYLKEGHIPLWILGGQQINRVSNHTFHLSQFHTLFLRQNQQGHWYVPSYCASTHSFIFLTYLQSLSPRSFLGQIELKPPAQTRVEELLNPIFPAKIRLAQWRRGVQQTKEGLIRFAHRNSSTFLRELYVKGWHPLLFPPYVGLPLTNNALIETAPLIWQTYILLDHFYEKKVGTVTTFTRLVFSWNERIRRSKIILREHLCSTESAHLKPVQEFLRALVSIGILGLKENNHYVLLQPITLSKNVEEALVQEEQFYLQHRF